MDDKRAPDAALLTPILVGLLSLVGIGVIFFSVRSATLRLTETAPTATPFRFLYLGTEPSISTLTPQPTPTFLIIEESPAPPEPSLPASLEPPLETGLPAFPTQANNSTAPSFPTQPAVRTFTPTFTPTIASVLAKYDDTYYAILYDGDWTSQTNVSGAYQNTLHISFTLENYALFTFVGQQVILTYQAGPSLGTIRIDLDGIEFQVSQASPQTQLVDWASPILIMGTHELLVEHLSGGSINIDAITIPEVRTATPTP
jgi:hypothetical protein